MIRTAVALLVVLGFAMSASAQDQKLPDDAMKAKGAVDEYIKKNNAEGGQIVWLDNEAA
jgi:hypothetical protein